MGLLEYYELGINNLTNLKSSLNYAYYQEISDICCMIGYLSLCAIFISYFVLPISKLSYIASIACIIGYGGMGIYYLRKIIGGMVKDTRLNIIKIHEEDEKLIRQISHIFIVLYLCYFIYYHIYKNIDIITNETGIRRVHVLPDILLSGLSHSYFFFAVTFGLTDLYGSIGLVFSHLTVAYNTKYLNILKTVEKIANIILAFGCLLAIFL